MINRRRLNMKKTNEKTDFKSLKKLFLYCRPYLMSIIIAIICAIIGVITTILGPKKISQGMDIITSGLQTVSGVDMSKFMEVVVYLITIYLIGVIANYTQQFIIAGVTEKTAKSLRKNINLKVNRLPLKFFDNTTRGDLLSTVTNDIDTISQTLSAVMSNLVHAVILFLGVVIMMFSINWILTLVTIGASLLGFFLIFLILSKSQKYFNRRQENLGEINGHIEEYYTNHNVVKAYNGEEQAEKDFNVINKKLYKNNWKSQVFSGLMPPLMIFAGNLSYALIFIVGVSLVLNGNDMITFGTIISFTIYARLFTQPLNMIAQSLSGLQQASASSKRVFNLLEEKELEVDCLNPKKIKDVLGNVEFRNVKFGYDKDLVIKDFSAKFKHGQKVAIVGPTGAGKTTLVNLLMRFYETNSGDILIDNVNIKNMKRSDVRNLFDMILQDTWLFDGTIRENLVYNNDKVNDENLDFVCEAVGLKHFIKTLKNGYDTKLDSSLGLSEGQKQQLTIARAMIKNSPLLILDEATSSVDTRTEIVIQKAMDKLTEGRTSFVIAHRLSTIKNADIILVLKDGDIVEQGNHYSLMKKNGYYKELYDSQFAKI